MPEQSLIIEVFKIAPGIAGAVGIAYFSYRHIHQMTDSFLAQMRDMSDKYAAEVAANRKATLEAQNAHAVHFKAEQDAFREREEDREKTFKEVVDVIMKKCRV